MAIALTAALVLAAALVVLPGPTTTPPRRFAHAQEFRRALPGYQFSFPRDHYAHPEFKTEWWYYTGHLATAKGERYGYQLTFFRVGVADEAPGGAGAAEGRKGAEASSPPRGERAIGQKGGGKGPASRWAIRQLYFAHLAVTDVGRRAFHHAERLSRGALGEAGASTEALRVWLGGWEVRGEGEVHHLVADDGQIGLDLRLTPRKPPVVHGINGVSQKGEGEGFASHYYSLTRLQATGALTVGGRRLAVTGSSWMDHEFGSSQLKESQVGWDWFGLQLTGDTELMLYRIRRQDGTPDPHSSGTLIHPDGRTEHLPLQAVKVEVLGRWRSPRSGAVYPMGWRLSLPGHQGELTVTPLVQDQELETPKSTRVTYWEGAVTVSGRLGGRTVTGTGYVELVGYAERLRQRL
ncbi:MAG: carotenoid 1,2-hydratase [Deltaproteobacteria bacterium]|nr:carotenoid 1,2-hydratase [Deltaproteobacteria bacterium]